MEKSAPQYLCFGDFEFTCGGHIGIYNCEILSVGIIICDRKYTVKEKFYCTTKPLKYPKLTKRCRELTHLSQEEINDSPDSNDVMQIVLGLMDRYSVSKIYVWGNFDKTGFLGDIKQHRKYSRDFSYIRKIQSKISDIQNRVTKKMCLPQAVNIEELASAFGFVPESGTFHNAYNDAVALYTICKTVYTTEFQKNENFIRLKENRIEKIEQARKDSEEKRLNLALSVVLSPEEKQYYETISDGNHKSELDTFIFARARIIYVLNKYPDSENFYLIIFSFPKDMRIIPESKFRNENDKIPPNIFKIERNNIGGILLTLCKSQKIPALIQ